MLSFKKKDHTRLSGKNQEGLISFYIEAYTHLADNREDLRYLLHTIKTDGKLMGETHLLSPQASDCYFYRARVMPTWQRLSIMGDYNDPRTQNLTRNR